MPWLKGKFFNYSRHTAFNSVSMIRKGIHFNRKSPSRCSLLKQPTWWCTEPPTQHKTSPSTKTRLFDKLHSNSSEQWSFITMTSAVTSISHLPTACNQPGSASHTTPSNNSDVTLPPAPIIPGYSTSTIAAGASTNAPKCSRSSRSGRWTPDEKLLFLHGLHIFGRGRWKKIRQFLPTR